MLWEQWKNWKDDSCEVRDLTSFSNLLVMAFALSLAAMLVGRKVGCAFSKYAGVLGGFTLIGIGIKILVEHLLGVA